MPWHMYYVWIEINAFGSGSMTTVNDVSILTAYLLHSCIRETSYGPKKYFVNEKKNNNNKKLS